VWKEQCNITYSIYVLFVWLISHQPAVLFSQNKPNTSNQLAVLFSQNKSASDISHQPNEQAVYTKGWLAEMLFGWHILAYLGLSWLISSHIILFILPAEHYSFYQPNTLRTFGLFSNQG
jgi:hypothetical protein